MSYMDEEKKNKFLHYYLDFYSKSCYNRRVMKNILVIAAFGAIIGSMVYIEKLFPTDPQAEYDAHMELVDEAIQAEIERDIERQREQEKEEF